MLYLHASPSPPTAFFICPICLSFLCFLAVVIILCFIPGEILGANYRFCRMCVACVTITVLKGLERDRRYRINGPKGAAIGDEHLFGSDLRFAVGPGTSGGPFGL
jgi:hypothetical protein